MYKTDSFTSKILLVPFILISKTNMNSVIDANTNLVEDVLKRKDESTILMQCLDDIVASSSSLARELGLPSHSNTK